VYLFIKASAIQWQFLSTMFQNIDELNLKACENYSGFLLCSAGNGDINKLLDF
jgi:hypothetical protein